MVGTPSSAGRLRRTGLRRLPRATLGAAACGLVAVTALSGCAQQATAATRLQVGTAYVEQPAASGITEAYLVIQNNGAADRLTSAQTSVGGQVTFRGPAGHGASAMRTVGDIQIPAGTLVRLVPNGFHLMITGAGRMRAGTEITITLVFARAGRMSVAAEVTNPATGGSSYFVN